MSCSSEGHPIEGGRPKSTLGKLKEHAKEFMDATPEEHKK
jgi:hypothetical protein